VARRGQDLQVDIADGEPITVVQYLDGELGPSGFPCKRSRRPWAASSEMAGQKISVEMRLDHPLDPQPEPGCVGQIAGDMRCGSTTTARPLDSSPIRYEACDKQTKKY
jgi:hypothetical protein